MTTWSQGGVLERAGLLLRRFTREREAAAVVEFAIVVALLMVIVMGTLSWSRYFFVRASLTNAVREGARYGAVLNLSDSALIGPYTRARIADTITRNLTTVSVSFPGANARVRVKVTSTFNPATLLVMRSARTILDSAEFRREQTP